MSRFDDMAVFVAVCEEHSFAAAARKLNLSAPSATRAVAALEAHIGTLLLTRNTRSVHLTQTGERYYHDCRRILDEVQGATDNAAGTDAPPRGVLTITAPVMFGDQFITPIILEFLAKYPELNIRSLFVDSLVNLADEGVDVAVRLAPIHDATTAPSVVGKVRRVVCAAPALIAREGVPHTPRELSRFRLIHSANVGDWRFMVDGREYTLPMQAPLVVNSNRAAIAAAVQGFGLTRVMSYQVAQELADGALQLVLDDFSMPPVPIQVLALEGRVPPPKVQRFIEFCAARLRAHPALR